MPKFTVTPVPRVNRRKLTAGVRLDQADPIPGHVVEGIEQLAAKGEIRSFGANVLLIKEGDTGDNLFIIQSGKVRVFASDGKGKEVTLGMFEAGDYVGEMALDGGPRSASVETVTPTICAVVNREILRAHIAENPEFALQMMARLIRRARLATESVRNLALIDTYGRLRRFLESTVVPHDNDTHILPERMTHQELANHVACSREMISRLLKSLEGGGYIRTENERIVLIQTLPARW